MLIPIGRLRDSVLISLISYPSRRNNAYGHCPSLLQTVNGELENVDVCILSVTLQCK
ncbi:hypothetical protein KSB_27010 [Ktedonobacter robiniae]|uniref:Uncharacterized protein n=1 Tax=Ktedonobacter robiniae TaxID=2778365 RepID=A0ABQ3UNI3_9CHLR|nr:hypothetical protein KSB_27010 [Ktedonobacter robiniae]